MAGKVRFGYPPDKLIQCLICKHWLGKSETGLICKAFPDGIPNDIVWGKHDHRKPYHNDNGILYKEQ